MRLYFKFLGMTATVLSLVLGLLVFMSYMKYQNIISEIVSSRLMVVSDSVGSSIDEAMGYGMKLQELTQLSDMLVRSQKLDEGIQEIAVVNASGQVLFSSAAGRVNHKFGAAITANLNRESQSDWLIEEQDYLVVGLNLRNALELPIGGVVIRYSKAEYNTSVAEMLEHLIKGALGLLVLFALLLAVLLGLSFKNFFLFYNATYKELTKTERPVDEEARHGHKKARTYLMTDVRIARRNQSQVKEQIDGLTSKTQPNAVAGGER